MKYLSVCSGIEAATVAWEPLGWPSVGFSEIEKFPSAVLNYHHSHVQNLGDMTKYKEWDIERPELIVGGTPCQSFSVAGLRKGLDDPRGNLSLVYLGLVERFQPRWVVWENVPGVLSSYSGPQPPSDLEEGQEWEAEETSDFECFTTALGKIGYGWAYRILDAQYFGVPQRRRRVFVVGYLGDWRRAAAVLFERHSMSGDSPPSREEGKRVAPCLSQSLKSSGGGNAPLIMAHDPASTLQTTSNDYSRADDFNCVAYGIPGNWIGRKPENGGNAVEPHHDKSPCLTSTDKHAVCFAQNTRDELREMEVAGAPAARPGMKQQSYLRQDMQVRRLTPIECEKLQGFPTGYTRIPWRNKPAESCPDGPRYKALGNSMAVPVMRWIGERIEEVDKLQSTPSLESLL